MFNALLIVYNENLLAIARYEHRFLTNLKNEVVMKKFSTILCIAGTAVALSACNGQMGNVDDEAPYAQERTATHTNTVSPAPAPAPRAERVFRAQQTK